MTSRLAPAVAAVLATVAPCAAQTPAPLDQRYDFSRGSARHDLPGRLDEISGLAFAADGRLFAHGDERGHVFEIDPRTGEVGKRMEVGGRTVVADFEGIAIARQRFFLVSSRGLLFEFREVGDGEESPYRVSDVFGPPARCEVEGLDYELAAGTLWVACKTLSSDLEGVVVHRVPLDPEAERPPPLHVRASELAEHGLEEFHPSALALDPAAGRVVLVSAREEALLEVDRAGDIVAVVELSRDRHPQPEGLVFGPDGTLYLADEENGRDARLTAYTPRRPPGGP